MKSVTSICEKWPAAKQEAFGIFVVEFEGIKELHSLENVHPLQVWSEQTQTWVLMNYKVSA